MPETSLKRKTIKGVLWNSIEKFLVKGASFIISIILARILSPSDYGLIGMLTVFIALSNVFIESGLVKALIQKQDRTDTDLSTAFYTNVAIALILYFILFFTAPYIAAYFNEQKLKEILRILSLNLIIGSLNIVQRAVLMVKMDFKSLAFINFSGTMVGGGVGIAMAYTGCGVWALVGQSIASTLTMFIIFPIYSKWTPRIKFSVQSFKHLFAFGSKLLISGTVATVVNNISTVAIGKNYTTSQLGFYTRASQFSEMIAFTVNDILGGVTFPVLSELQNDRARITSVYRKSLYYTALVIFPVMILMALLAKPLVEILLTEKWLPCVVLLQILCISRMLVPLSSINMNLLNAVGRSDLFLKIDLSKVPIILIFLAITVPISVKAICIGTLITNIICFFINTYYPKKLFGYGAWEQVKDYAKLLLPISLMCATVCISNHLFDNSWVQLFVGAFSGSVVYVGSCFIFRAVSQEEIKAIFAIRN